MPSHVVNRCQNAFQMISQNNELKSTLESTTNMISESNKTLNSVNIFDENNSEQFSDTG